MTTNEPPERPDAQLTSIIRMVNQIADNQPQAISDDEATEAVVAHLRKFWPRVMKQRLAALACKDSDGVLSDIARAAGQQL